MKYVFELSELPDERGQHLIGTAKRFYLDVTGLSPDLAKAEISRHSQHYNSLSSEYLRVLDKSYLQGDEILHLQLIGKEIAQRFIQDKHPNYSIGSKRFYGDVIPEGHIIECFGMKLVLG